MNLSKEDIERFWSKVNVADNEYDCWEWKNCNTGRPIFFINGKSYPASRISWMIKNKKIKQNMVICHNCDNPKCINPNHLFIGTQKDNINDYFNKKKKAGFYKSNSDYTNLGQFDRNWIDKLNVAFKMIQNKNKFFVSKAQVIRMAVEYYFQKEHDIDFNKIEKENKNAMHNL